jgi:hypothetical protein
MANPNVVACPVGEWTKVATNISLGMIWRMDTSPSTYLYTYRDTGEAAPTEKTEGVPIFTEEEQNYEQISATNIDIYIWPIKEAGSVRVDS